MFQFLDFYADWCGPCQAMKPIFEEIEKDYEGKVEFKKVDVEVEGALAQEFGVVSIPTFVVLKDGKEVSRKMGAMPKEVLKQWLDSSLN
jgi:thioredoxin 1